MCRYFGEPGSPRFNYFVYCAAVFETEVDVLTGEYQIRRVDIMYDCGERSVLGLSQGDVSVTARCGHRNVS